MFVYTTGTLSFFNDSSFSFFRRILLKSVFLQSTSSIYTLLYYR
ncbi:hypothetical protein HMPREF9442_02712 [Paraprevotella xylaniphila YIT 11841]|uniref:Uncharacterized protein n=1 Tax=Paraprevotella xylaniphila YIT 11841 TaxID=762982 RepID=F3QWY0_9BACT|nr:hypothetical protein HMPREF9442_02712 [Paraprevotella xylaniphila YIT 11841]